MENKENYFFESFYQALIHFFCLVHLPWNRWLGIISTNNSGIWAWNRWLGIISTIWVFCHPCWYLCAFLVYSKDNTFQWQLLCMYSARHFCFDLNSVWSKIGVNSNFLCLQWQFCYVKIVAHYLCIWSWIITIFDQKRTQKSMHFYTHRRVPPLDCMWKKLST